MAPAAYCTRCGTLLEDHASCERTTRPGTPLDPPRFCGGCGARMTIQVAPTGYTAECLRCIRRARFAAAAQA